MTYAVYPKQGELIPSILEPVQVLGQNGQPVGELATIFYHEFAQVYPIFQILRSIYTHTFVICRPGCKFAQNTKPTKFGSVLQGCSFENFINGNGQVDLFAYLNRSIPEGTEAPARIKGSAFYLTRSQQLAVVHPPTVKFIIILCCEFCDTDQAHTQDGRPETWLDILNPGRHQVWRIKLPLADMSSTES